MNSKHISGHIFLLAALLILFSSCASTRYKDRKWKKKNNDCNCSQEVEPYQDGRMNFTMYG